MFLEADTRLKTAARVARTFRLDPIVVLDADTKQWLIRVAANNVVARDEKEAADAANKNSNRGR